MSPAWWSRPARGAHDRRRALRARSRKRRRSAAVAARETGCLHGGATATTVRLAGRSLRAGWIVSSSSPCLSAGRPSISNRLRVGDRLSVSLVRWRVSVKPLRVRQAEATRSLLVEVARQNFTEHGYAAT